MGRRATGPAVYQRGSKWWVRWADGHGGKVRQALVDRDGVHVPDDLSEDVAQAEALARYNEWQHRLGSPDSQPEEEVGVRTLGVILAAYVDDHDEWSLLTDLKYLGYIRELEYFFGADRMVDSIRSDEVRGYRQWLRDGRQVLVHRVDVPAEDLGFTPGPLSARSINNRRDFVLQVGQWAIDNEEMARNPFRAFRPVEGDQVRTPDPFTVEEVRRILKVAGESMPWFYPCLVLAAVCGIRRGSLLGLCVCDYDVQGKKLMVPKAISKQGRASEYFLPDATASILEGLVQGHPSDAPLFRALNGGRMYEGMFDTSECRGKGTTTKSPWRRVLELADVPVRGIHQLRGGVDSNLVDKLLSDAVSVTQHTKDVAKESYFKVRQRSQRELIAMLEREYGITGVEPNKDVS